MSAANIVVQDLGVILWANTAPAITEFPLALSEFCTRLSAKETRVELIGAFEHTERVAGRTSDLDSNYAGRFVAFATQPV